MFNFFPRLFRKNTKPNELPYDYISKGFTLLSSFSQLCKSRNFPGCKHLFCHLMGAVIDLDALICVPLIQVKSIIHCSVSKRLLIICWY